MASDEASAPVGFSEKLNENDMETRRENEAFWSLISHAMLLAAGLLIYFTWDEKIKGPWYPRGFLLEIAIFFVVCFS